MTPAAPVDAITPGGPGVHTDEARRAARMRTSLPYLLLVPGIAWLIFFFLVPILTMASQSLQTGDLYNGYSLTWHWSTYWDALSSYHEQLWRSFRYALAATAFALIIAYPLAYAIAFKAGKWKNTLLVLVVAPFFVSFLVRTLAWQTILADNGWVVKTVKDVGAGFLLPQGRILSTWLAVVCGLTYNFLPFMTLPLYASLEKIDPRLVEAANDLYSNPITAFFRVTFPLSLPGVVAGTLLTFIPAMGDFVNVEFLGNPRIQMIGNVIEKQFLVVTDYPAASALSVILMIVILVMVLAYIRKAGTEDVV